MRQATGWKPVPQRNHRLETGAACGLMILFGKSVRMSQVLSQVLGQHMRLEQRLTPQLIQSMDILQLNVAALEQRIAEELERNVALEAGQSETAPPPEADQSQVRESRTAADAPESESFNRLDRMSREYDLDFDSLSQGHRRTVQPERDAKMDAMANTAARPQSLAEYLLEQWVLLDLDADVRRAGEAIIYSLEDDGYLKTRLDEVALSATPPIALDVMEKALDRVQHLEPLGIAARDYQECMLIQLDAQPGNNEIERDLIKNHLSDVVRNRFPAIAKATGYSVGEIAEAVRAIGTTLNLHPALMVIDRPIPRITPDVIIEHAEDGSDLVVRLTRGNMPELRVSTQYADMARDKEVDKNARTFIRKQVENASLLIDAVHFRRSRLLDVSRAVVEKQREFFDAGPSALKILRMSDLAAEMECDPSTISRTVADKYAQTPRGIYPLRYFFTGGKETEDGSSAGWESVRTRVAEIIEQEDRSAPLQDDKIAAMLCKEGMEISRRTVAKYRKQLEIPSARQRREYSQT